MKRRLEPVTYPPGHFLALVIEHNWPPGFVPSAPERSHVALREAAARARATSLANGNTGTILGGLSPKSAKQYATGEVSRAAIAPQRRKP